MFLDKRKDKRENFCVINVINDSDYSFMFFRQRNTTEFKLKNFIKTLWWVPTAKNRARSRQSSSPNFFKFFAKQVNFLAKVIKFGECFGELQSQRIVWILAEVPRQRGQVWRMFKRVHFPVCWLGSSPNVSPKLVKFGEKITLKIIKINQEKVLSGFQPQRTKPVFAQLLAKPYF